MIKRVLILFIAIISSGYLFASHLVGGSLGYEYMGQVGANYRYKIILTVYNNCDNNSQIPIPVASHNVSIYQQDIGGNPMGGGNKSLFQTISVPIVDSNLVQPPVSSGCAVGQSVCIYKAVYETLVDLPLNFNGYHLYFENFARNAAITNLLNPGGTAMAFHAYIAPSLVNNSSPVFQDDPVPFLCVNDTVSILNTAIDPDGDQLIFSFVTPFQGAGQAPSPLPWTIPTVNYNGGYSTAQPFGAGGFSFINGATGLTQYMSPTTGNYVVAVEIREYRNGNLIGVSRRDLQLLVITCPPNPAPNLSNTGGSGVTQYTISECDNLSFPITFTDPNGDSLTLTATGQIFDPNFMNPPATINSPVTGAATVTSTFNWTAPCGSAQALPYQFSVSATDNGCPPKTTNEVYQITVEPPTPPDTIIGPLTVCPNTTASYTTSPISGYTFNWVVTGGTLASGQGTDSITVNWGSSGTGTITLNSLNGCGCPSDVISINVNILPSPFADAGNDTTICLGDSVQLGGSPTGPGGSTFTWTPTTSLSSSTVANPIAFPSSTTTYVVTVDNGICPTTDTVTVFVGSALINAGNDTTMCVGDSVQLNATGGVSYSWSPTTGLSNPNIANPIAFPNTTTTYVVTVTDSLSCTGVDSVTVTVVSPPVITITNDTTICDGACVQLNATGGTSYSWSPTTGLSNPNIANPTACPTVNTTYVVTVSNAANCTNTDSVTITINPLPTITASNDTTICDGACAQLNVSGGTGYTWSPTTGLSNPNISNPTACPTVTTTYVVTGTDANSCTNTDTVVVTVSPLPTANAGNDTTICIGDSVQLNATGGVSYSWTPAGSLTNPNIANPIAFPNTTTTYIVTVTDGLGCVDTDTVIITVATLPVITISNDTTICDGACAQLIATGGTSYSWSPTTGLSNPNIANPIACPTVNTTYVVTVSNAANCTATDSVTITINPLPTIIASNDTTICDGACAQLNASGGTGYTWSPTTGLSNPNIANPTACPTVTTTYVVTGTDVNSCTSTDTVVVTVSPLPTANAGNDTTICIGDSVQLNATGGTSYTWTPAGSLTNPNIANPIAFPNTTTTYIVTVTDGLGCVDTDTVIVTVANLPVITINNDTTICEGACVQLNATGGTSYSWSPTTGLSNPNIANPTACPTVNTTYVVIVTNANNCASTDSVTITINPLPTITASNDTTICDGSCAQLNATGGTSYVWLPTTGLSNPNIANPTACPTVTTTYVVTGTDANSCTSTDTVVVTVSPLPTANAGPDTSICGVGSVVIGGSPSGPTGSTFSWSPGVTLNDSTLANPIASPIVNTTYVLTVTDTNGCENTDTVNVTINTSPVVDAGNDTNICTGSSVVIGGNPTTPSSASTYSWTPVGTLNNTTIANPTATPTVSPTTYYVTVTDSVGCTNIDSVTITINPLPTITASNDTTICDGACAQLNASGGTSYVWSPTTGLSNPNIANPTACPTVTTTYVVTGTDANSCTSTDTVVVTVSPLPTANAGNDTTICIGDPVQLNATGGTSYTWTPAGSLTNPNIANPIAFPNTTTTYIVTVTDGLGCVDTDTVIVTVANLPVITINNDTTICDGACVQLNATGGTSYSWSPTTGLSNPNIANPTACPTVNTTYVVIVTNANNCASTDSVTITINPLPTITASNDTTICDGSCAQLNATGGTSYVWSPSAGLSDSTIANPTACVTTPTTYVVTGTDANGCVNSDTVTISINPLPTIIAGPDVWVCVGDSVQIFANGGTSYTWSPTAGLSNPNISNPMAAPANTTTYIVTGTDANGCSNTDSVVVTANDTVPISLANDTTICAGDSVQLGGNPTSVTGTTFSWSPAGSLNNPTSANPIAFPTVTTTYYVTATNDTCSTTDSITVTVHPISNISAGNDLSMCFGDTVQLSASGGASYVWSPGNSLSDSTIFNPLAFPTVTTPYVVSALDTNGCSNSDTVLVTVNPLPTVNAGIDVSICEGDTAQLQATGASSYLWTPSAGLSDTTIANPLAFPTVTTIYVVTGTDTNSCSNTDTVVVNVNALPTIVAFSDTAVCSGVSVQLNATGGSAYTWTPVATLNNANIPNPIASPITTTTYQVVGVDTNGCSNVDSVTITINALPTINAGTDVAICIGDTAQLQASGGNGYLWTPSVGLSDTTIANPLAFPTVTTTYIVMGTDTNACEGTDTVVVTVNPLPIISAGLTDTVYMCNGDSAQLNATGGTSYVWTPNTNITNNTIANPFVFPPVTTTYYVTGTDANSCSNSDSVVVSVFAIPNLTDTVLCVGDSIQLTAYGPPGATYTWTPSTDLSNPNIANPYTSTIVTITYTVTVQDTNGCIDTTQITVTAEDKPNAAFTVETTPACDGILAVFDNTSTGADSYLWLFGDGSQSNETHPTYTFTYGASFTTILNAYSTNGCLDTASFNISSLSFEEQFNLTPPSVLTPNRDGHNDEFKLDLPEAISACTNIEIFNRWGMKMFESKGQNIGWDGRTTAGEEVPDGTYFYIVDVKGIVKKGSITLMR